MPDEKGPSGLTTAAGLALVGFDAWLAANGYAVPVGAVTALAVPYVLGKVGREKVERLWMAFRRAMIVEVELPEDEADSEIRRLLDDPKAAEKLYESFRSMMSSRSEATWPYAAKLAAHYVVRKLEPDTFFLRAGWLLVRCEEEDIDILRQGFAESEALLGEVPAEGRAPLGVEWLTHDQRGLCLAVNPDGGRGSHRPLRTVGQYSVWRAMDIVALLTESRLGVARPNSVHFPLSQGHIERLFALFRT